jgi:hypothetical protein
MECLLAQRMVQRVVVQLDGERILVSTVHDARHKAGVTQAAARTRAMYVTLLGNNFDLHDQSPNTLPRPGAGSFKKMAAPLPVGPATFELTR